ncbi:hypothetical protein ACFE04_010350 [Oxalis oulophora]
MNPRPSLSNDQNYSTQLGELGDTTYTKIFVGGLAWETRKETLRRYFEKFGQILEAVVINEKSTGRSKGYGFVTFKESDGATRAVQNPYPVIDGRRANCNLAFLGASKNHPPTNPQHGTEKQGPATSPGAMVQSPYFRQPFPQYSFPYSAYGYPAYSPHQDIYAMNYYNVQRGQQFPPYYPSPGGVYISYPSLGNSTTHQYPKMVPHPPFMQTTQQFPGSFGFISVPSTSSSLAAANIPRSSPSLPFK